WLALQRSSRAAFQPRLRAVEPVVPVGRVPPDAPFRVGVRVANETGVEGSAFVVAVLPDGEEVEGSVVPVPPRGSVLVPVDLHLPEGDHVVALVTFASG